MAKYCYPAVFTPDGDGYSVEFPDIEGCYTCGDSLEEAMEMAEDVLNSMLAFKEDEGIAFGAPSDVRKIKTEDGEFVSLFMADTDTYRRKINNKSVKKTLTIPQWLNVAAEERGVNFSKVLQDALKKELQIA